MKFCFVTYGPIEFASSRFRCYWVAEHLDAQVVTFQQMHETQTLPQADVYVFQKHGAPPVQKQLLENGKQVWWDACDPMHWFSPDAVRSITEHLTGVVTSNRGLSSDMRRWGLQNVHTIADRMNLGHYVARREHGNTRPVRLIWFGLHVNRIALGGAWANLHRLVANGHSIELTIMDDRPDLALQFGTEVPIYYRGFSLEQESATLAGHDIALLPPYPGPWGEVKSNNKTLTAWACGLPVTDGLRYAKLERLVEDADHRRHLGAQGRRDVELFWRIEHSAQEWERLVETHRLPDILEPASEGTHA